MRGRSPVTRRRHDLRRRGGGVPLLAYARYRKEGATSASPRGGHRAHRPLRGDLRGCREGARRSRTDRHLREAVDRRSPDATRQCGQVLERARCRHVNRLVPAARLSANRSPRTCQSAACGAARARARGRATSRRPDPSTPPACGSRAHGRTGDVILLQARGALPDRSGSSRARQEIASQGWSHSKPGSAAPALQGDRPHPETLTPHRPEPALFRPPWAP